MSDILLIHGSAHGAWCWSDVSGLLSDHGHRVRALDLPSHGADQTPTAEVTLDLQARAIVEVLDGPTVLVGHSLGGAAITAAAEMAPDRIARLIYLAAWVPGAGQSIAELRDPEKCAALLAAMRISSDGLSATFDEALVDDLFYHDCPPEARAFARANLCAQAMAISSTPVRTGAAHKDVPRSYVICDADRAIPPDVQAAQCAGWDSVAHLATGHSPFFAAPGLTADTIHRLAGLP